MEKINFKIPDNLSLAEIENKLLEITECEKNILEEYKDSDQTLQPRIYNQLHDITTETFDNYRQILMERRKRLLKQAVVSERTTTYISELKNAKRNKIESRYEIRLLRYNNRLYRKQCALKYKLDRRATKQTHREIAAEYRKSMPSILSQLISRLCFWKKKTEKPENLPP